MTGASTAATRRGSRGREIGYSERQLHRIFSDTFGLNPQDLLKVLPMNVVVHALGATREHPSVDKLSSGESRLNVRAWAC